MHRDVLQRLTTFADRFPIYTIETNRQGFFAETIAARVPPCTQIHGGLIIRPVSRGIVNLNEYALTWRMKSKNGDYFYGCVNGYGRTGTQRLPLYYT